MPHWLHFSKKKQWHWSDLLPSEICLTSSKLHYFFLGDYVSSFNIVIFKYRFVLLEQDFFFQMLVSLIWNNLLFFIYIFHPPLPIGTYLHLWNCNFSQNRELAPLAGWSINFHVCDTDLFQPSSSVICIHSVNYSASNAVESGKYTWSLCRIHAIKMVRASKGIIASLQGVQIVWHLVFVLSFAFLQLVDISTH